MPGSAGRTQYKDSGQGSASTGQEAHTAQHSSFLSNCTWLCSHIRHRADKVPPCHQSAGPCRTVLKSLQILKQSACITPFCSTITFIVPAQDSKNLSEQKWTSKGKQVLKKKIILLLPGSMKGNQIACHSNVFSLQIFLLPGCNTFKSYVCITQYSNV